MNASQFRFLPNFSGHTASVSATTGVTTYRTSYRFPSNPIIHTLRTIVLLPITIVFVLCGTAAAGPEPDKLSGSGVRHYNYQEFPLDNGIVLAAEVCRLPAAHAPKSLPADPQTGYTWYSLRIWFVVPDDGKEDNEPRKVVEEMSVRFHHQKAVFETKSLIPWRMKASNQHTRFPYTIVYENGQQVGFKDQEGRLNSKISINIVGAREGSGLIHPDWELKTDDGLPSITKAHQEKKPVFFGKFRVPTGSLEDPLNRAVRITPTVILRDSKGSGTSGSTSTLSDLFELELPLRPYQR